jgi:hypothetical protein
MMRVLIPKVISIAVVVGLLIPSLAFAFRWVFSYQIPPAILFSFTLSIIIVINANLLIRHHKRNEMLNVDLKDPQE